MMSSSTTRWSALALVVVTLATVTGCGGELDDSGLDPAGGEAPFGFQNEASSPPHEDQPPADDDQPFGEAASGPASFGDGPRAPGRQQQQRAGSATCSDVYVSVRSGLNDPSTARIEPYDGSEPAECASRRWAEGRRGR